MILEWLDEGKSEEEIVAILVRNFRISEPQAQFRIDIELGRTKGDVDLDYDGPPLEDFEYVYLGES